MKINIEEIMGDHKNFWIKIFAFRLILKITFSISASHAKNRFARAKGGCVSRSNDKKNSKLSAESNGVIFI
jgi:hypothetical protein